MKSPAPMTATVLFLFCKGISAFAKGEAISPASFA
jgi:hypothetical protein